MAPAGELIIARFHMYSEVYFHKVCRSIAACIKKAFWLVNRAQLVSGEEFRTAALTLDDRSYLSWLNQKLVLLDPSTHCSSSSSLLQNTLLSGNRYLFKRLATLYDAYEQSELFTPAIQKCSTLTMAQLELVENEFLDRIDKIYKVRGNAHSCLIDVPPPGKDVDTPRVVDTSDSKRQRYLHDVHPPCAEIRTSLKKTMKIRVFVSPELHGAIRSRAEPKALAQLLAKVITEFHN